MLQIYLFTELYLFISSCIILSDSTANRFLIFINLRKFMFKDTKHTAFTLILNAMLLVLNIFFPVNPGPVFLGDFLVSLNLFILLFTFYFKTSKEEYQSEVNKKNTLGYFTLGVCIIHLFFPGFVIL